MRVAIPKFMRKALAAFCLLSILFWGVWFIVERKQPGYNGKTIRAWFNLYTKGRLFRVTPVVNVIQKTPGGVAIVIPPPAPADIAARKIERQKGEAAGYAFAQIGTNAIPFLISILKARPTRFHHWYETNYAGRLRFASEILPPPRNHSLEHAAAMDLIFTLRLSSPELRRAMIHFLLEKGTINTYIRNFPFETEDVMFVLEHHRAKNRYEEMIRLIRLVDPLMRETCYPYLVLASDHPDDKIKLQALSVLDNHGHQAAPIEQKLRFFLEDPDPELRYISARLLARLQPFSDETREALEDALSDPNGMVQNVARRALEVSHATENKR